MNWTRPTVLLCAMGASLWLAVDTGGQPPPPGPLPAALQTHVENERYDIVTSVRGLPLGVRDRLQAMFGSATLDIAEPGAPFDAGTGPASPLPLRRLIAAGCSADYHCLVYYERGGDSHTWRAALFQWSPAATRFDGGGTAPGGLTTVEDVRKALVSGAINGEAGPW